MDYLQVTWYPHRLYLRGEITPLLIDFARADAGQLDIRDFSAFTGIGLHRARGFLRRRADLFARADRWRYRLIDYRPLPPK